MKVSNFIICDDIRSEVGGKASIMGVYSDLINYTVTPDQKGQWPKSKRLALYIQLDLEDGESIGQIKEFEIFIKQDNEIKGIGRSPTPPPSPSTPARKENGIVLNAIFTNFKFQKAGEIFFILKFFGDNDQLLSEISLPRPLKVIETVISEK